MEQNNSTIHPSHRKLRQENLAIKMCEILPTEAVANHFQILLANKEAQDGKNSNLKSIWLESRTVIQMPS